MAKPKAEAWLREAFAAGVPELAVRARPRVAPPYPGAKGRCYLAQFDERRRPCVGPFERFHFLRRQTVEDCVAREMPEDGAFFAQETVDAGEDAALYHFFGREDLILLAAWDARNGEVGCEGHHRRFDSHLTPALIVPRTAIPERTVDFACEWGIPHLLDRFPV